MAVLALVAAVGLGAAALALPGPLRTPAPSMVGLPATTDGEGRVQGRAGVGPEGPTRPVGPAFRDFVADLDRPSPELTALTTADDAALVGLADLSCAAAARTATEYRLAAAAVDLGADPTPGPAVALAALDEAEAALVVGSLVGLTCPELLPRRPNVGPELASLWAADHPAHRFVTTVDDAHLADLAAHACGLVDRPRSTTAFGLAAREHRRSILTEPERSALDVGDHSELFGALIGWSCPHLLPTIDR